MLLFFLTGLSFEIKRIIIAFWAFVKREIENILRKFGGGERRIATGAARPRNDKGFCKKCGCIIDGAVGGQPQGSPQRKIRVIFRDLLRGLIAGISPGGAVV